MQVGLAAGVTRHKNRFFRTLSLTAKKGYPQESRPRRFAVPAKAVTSLAGHMLAGTTRTLTIGCSDNVLFVSALMHPARLRNDGVLKPKPQKPHTCHAALDAASHPVIAFKSPSPRPSPLKGEGGVLIFYDSINIDNQSVFQINALHTVELEIYKLKKFACKSLKGKDVHSGIRLIYAYSTGTLLIHLIEIYYKGDRENEDRERIKKFLKE